MKDRDLAGELKDVWLAVQNKREREKGLNQDVMYKVLTISNLKFILNTQILTNSMTFDIICKNLFFLIPADPANIYFAIYVIRTLNPSPL